MDLTTMVVWGGITVIRGWERYLELAWKGTKRD